MPLFFSFAGAQWRQRHGAALPSIDRMSLFLSQRNRNGIEAFEWGSDQPGIQPDSDHDSYQSASPKERSLRSWKHEWERRKTYSGFLGDSEQCHPGIDGRSFRSTSCPMDGSDWPGPPWICMRKSRGTNPRSNWRCIIVGQSVLGGTAIALLRAWSMLEGGSCGDSAYRFGSSRMFGGGNAEVWTMPHEWCRSMDLDRKIWWELSLEVIADATNHLGACLNNGSQWENMMLNEPSLFDVFFGVFGGVFIAKL